MCGSMFPPSTGPCVCVKSNMCYFSPHPEWLGPFRLGCTYQIEVRDGYLMGYPWGGSDSFIGTKKVLGKGVQG